MINKYQITYQRSGSETNFNHGVLADGPISALNQFHKFAQTKTADRPALRPTEYRISALNLVYQDARKETVYSPYDLPNTSNPDMTPRPQHTNEAPEPSFGWTDQELGGKLS